MNHLPILTVPFQPHQPLPYQPPQLHGHSTALATCTEPSSLPTRTPPHRSSPAGDMSAQPGYVPKVASAQAWYDAPRCSSPPDWSSAQPDSEGRLWGTEAGTGTCVFRDQRGYPLFYSDLQVGGQWTVGGRVGCWSSGRVWRSTT